MTATFQCITMMSNILVWKYHRVYITQENMPHVYHLFDIFLQQIFLLVNLCIQKIIFLRFSQIITYTNYIMIIFVRYPVLSNKVCSLHVPSTHPWQFMWPPLYIPNKNYDVIMSTVAYQITSLAIVYSTVYSDVDQGKHQSSASLAFVRGIHRVPVNFPHKWPVTRKMFLFDDVIMKPCLALSTEFWET